MLRVDSFLARVLIYSSLAYIHFLVATPLRATFLCMGEARGRRCGVVLSSLLLAACGYVGADRSNLDTQTGLGGDGSVEASGGDAASGGAVSKGGSSADGGSLGTGATEASGGSDAAGGFSAAGGSPSGGDTGAGGLPGTGGSSSDAKDIAVFVDDFSTDGLGTVWNSKVRGDGCKLGIMDAKLQFAAAAQEVSRCEITTADRYDLSDSAVFVEIPGITNYYPELEVFFAIVDAEGNRVQLAFQNGQFAITATADGQSAHSDSATYRANYRFWRFSEFDGVLLVEASVNQLAWFIVSEFDVPFSVDAVAINLGVQVADPMEGEVSISVLGVNTD